VRGTILGPPTRTVARSLRSPPRTMAHQPPWSTRTRYECCTCPHRDIQTLLQQDLYTLVGNEGSNMEMRHISETSTTHKQLIHSNAPHNDIYVNDRPHTQDGAQNAIDCTHKMVAASVVYWLACWPLVPKFAGSKNPQHAFLRKGSKAVGPVTQICGTLKIPYDYVEVESEAQFSRPFLARSCPPSLIEGSAQARAVRGPPMRGPHTRGSSMGAPGVDGGN
jgi:hypothetical protein